MDNNNDNESAERRNSNTEYQPTKCRITKPPPPKPATNPLQFIKVAPCPLFQKAHEQIKKVEEVKKDRKDVREEAEDWQQNLDNWKSSRRKRQEHIIERVVEVKKLEQEEQERHRRKSKTFSEMIEDRSRGRHKFNIPIYDDDSHDLSDYGIGSSSSKTNSIKDFDTDDSCSILDEKDNQSFESPCNKDNCSASNPSQSEDETNNQNYEISSLSLVDDKTTAKFDFLNKSESSEFTYEGAIQDYRSRIRSKILVDDTTFVKNQDEVKSKEFSEAQSAIPKGEICKRKELFELEKPLEINNYESLTSRRLSEDFVNSQSIKQRLQSLEKCSDQILNVDKNDVPALVKQRLQNFSINDDKNSSDNISCKRTKPTKISNFLMDKSNIVLKTKPNINNVECKKNISKRCSSPETELYMNKLNMFNKDLDTLMSGIVRSNTTEANDPCVNINYEKPNEVNVKSSYKNISGIHTEHSPVNQIEEYEKNINLLSQNYTLNLIPQESSSKTEVRNTYDCNSPIDQDNIKNNNGQSTDETVKNKSHISIELQDTDPKISRSEPSKTSITESKASSMDSTELHENVTLLPSKTQCSLNFITGDEIILDSNFTLAPSTMIEPPKEKPPPPPRIDEESSQNDVKRLNSTKRIKREIHIKRSSFLGLDEPTDDQIYFNLDVSKPPDINTYLQKESKSEKPLFKKIQDENRIGGLSKVESHDSGLDIDRGRLSSDTWCSSIGDSNTPSPERQDSEQTNSITSEEDEITKKEREIIEMIEKEEKSRDVDFIINTTDKDQQINKNTQNPTIESYLNKGNFINARFVEKTPSFIDDEDSEVLKVEYELQQLEKEELERQRENMLFQENRVKSLLPNRHSLENIFDEVCPFSDDTDYRKSMPELQHIPTECRKSLSDMPNSHKTCNQVPNIDISYRKSMPDIQQAYYKSSPESQNHAIENGLKICMDHRKSMPELQRDMRMSAFKPPSPPIKKQPIIPGKPLRMISKEQKDRFLKMNPEMSDVLSHGKYLQQNARQNLQPLNNLPASSHFSNKWIQPRARVETKSYNQHWLYQEAELRRISEQQQNAAINRNNWQQYRQEKHLPDSIIQSLTQRVQNRTELSDRNQVIRRSDWNLNKDNNNQHPYLEHIQTMGHALPMPYSSSLAIEETQDKMLSVSGKKKCSYCNNELGRGAAMIIESLCLFYHMECFKCCVCHTQLGDGLMGTDVRVRNQKLHCHNCYSSDDGIKFSCV